MKRKLRKHELMGRMFSHGEGDERTDSVIAKSLTTERWYIQCAFFGRTSHEAVRTFGIIHFDDEVYVGEHHLIEASEAKHKIPEMCKDIDIVVAMAEESWRNTDARQNEWHYTESSEWLDEQFDKGPMRGTGLN
jgi:hypothetical protein